MSSEQRHSFQMLSVSLLLGLAGAIGALLFFSMVAPSSYSFPSGHALASFCFYGALAAILVTRLRSRRIRIALWTSSAVIILLIGLSRIYLGVHYTTDVLAGFAAALIWTVVVAFVEQRLALRRQSKRKRA